SLGFLTTISIADFSRIVHRKITRAELYKDSPFPISHLHQGKTGIMTAAIMQIQRLWRENDGDMQFLTIRRSVSYCVSEKGIV
ncbi:MAG: hypothetical protein ACSW8J_03830, partial [bacterium]